MRKTVIVVGGGFAGMAATKVLCRGNDLRIILIDRKNHHLFQPLLYQVATAGLSESDIASPIRGIFSSFLNVEVLLGEVISIDRQSREILLASRERMSYDYLVLAAGADKNYFGHPEWEKFAPSLKTLEDAVEIRRRLLMSYESAETSKSPEERRAFLTYVIVGGGPTGVELAGAISEIAHNTLKRDFRNIDPTKSEIYLLEAGPRILNSFIPRLSERAKKDLTQMNVKVLENTRVTAIGEDFVQTTKQIFKTRNIIWTAGVRASSMGALLETRLDPQGRVMVGEDLSIPEDPRVFVVGDLAHYQSPKHGVLPGLAPVAMQEGRYVGELILQEIEDPGRPRRPFRYFGKGNLATIGRKKAVVEFGPIRGGGFGAWLLWLAVHIVYLIGFRNKAIVLFQWAWSYFTFNKGARVIVRSGVGQSD